MNVDLSENESRVRGTWAIAMANREQVARMFYTLLFRSHPEVKPLFGTDIEAQGQKLVDTLNFIVDGLDAPDVLLPAARDLAIRHVGYGVLPEHYAAVGAALLETLETLLGPEFDADSRAAWEGIYGMLSSYMIEQAYPGQSYTKG